MSSLGATNNVPNDKMVSQKPAGTHESPIPVPINTTRTDIRPRGNIPSNTNAPKQHDLTNQYMRTTPNYDNFAPNRPQPVNRQSSPKYAKIQPAIAPKPISVLPKANTFSPIPTPKTGKPIQISSDDSIKSLNINTSKRWVLPPRPRPGRKPTASMEDDKRSSKSPATTAPNPNPTQNVNQTSTHSNTATNISKLGNSPKKRVKVCKKENEDLPQIEHQGSDSNGSMLLDQLGPQYTRSSKSGLSPPSSSPIPPAPLKQTDPKSEINELKLSYLAQLKEQELIRNYIEVISNQIKELSFVRNGVITFDALRNKPGNRTKKVGAPLNSGTSGSPRSNYDHLEFINNINDLNKFLGYLTKSSNIIHSVTKQEKKQQDAESVLNGQIHHYLDIRSKFKSLKLEEAKKIDSLKDKSLQKIGLDNKEAKHPKPSSILAGNVTSPTTFSQEPSKFANDLMRIKSTNLFDQDDDSLSVDLVSSDFNQELTNPGDELIIEDEDFLDVPHDKVDEILIDPSGLEIDEEQNLGNVKIYDKNEVPIIPKQVKKKSKLNCGFCSNDTPCLCLDADIDLSMLK